MTETYYKVQMRTPLGVKHGNMLVKIHHDRLTGHLDIMKHSEPFSGTINETGSCMFTGRLVTLMRVVTYHAAGVIDEKHIDLLLRGERNTFYITGTPCVDKIH